MVNRILIIIGGALALIIAILWLLNTSMFALPPEGQQPALISHRGVHQTYHRAALERDTCTAIRIDEPRHTYLENTIPSMQAAFDAGAAVVELDIHPTPDGHLAVFHDWTLDCRTDGTGVTRQTPMSVLKTLDIGYGYTADGGNTYPFRGKYVGAMPTLDEVFDAFPDRRFLINFKGRDPGEGQALAVFLQRRGNTEQVWGVYGSDESIGGLAATFPDVMSLSKTSMMACAKDYIAKGWTGYVPQSCRGRIMFVPVSHARLMWGWPHRFMQRMDGVGTRVVLLGPMTKDDVGTSGIDSAALLDRVPHDFGGYVWSNRIEEIGPMVVAPAD
ncbi:glycerophosphodiester phosphodiesterase family protein [Parvularcula sp. LCG005]|uniref:glycerophosphodiester phosphodiesterase family protein n=1 Tax=Parvularcula sp. LCG005 TaxID=3078805 RepID=UPI0029423365|nr:glycerophosphodiester phosphodiesterase family protein [Parvularcula sp. LCG005]WOI53408.1 glycerophosphodiester phosphodiesterase family protein [Parvularcula sp. LCG005]